MREHDEEGCYLEGLMKSSVSGICLRLECYIFAMPWAVLNLGMNCVKRTYWLATYCYGPSTHRIQGRIRFPLFVGSCCFFFLFGRISDR